MKIIDINSTSELDELLKNQKIVLVDFWAEWCGPCRMLSQIYHEMENEMTSNKELLKYDFTVAKIDTETQAEDLKAFIDEIGISSIPTVLMFRNGKLVHIHGREGQTHDRLIGVRPKEFFYELVKFLTENIPNEEKNN